MTDTYRPEDLDWAMGQFRSNDERNTRRVLTDPTAPNPDEEAQVRRVAQQSGLPDADVRLDLGAGERAATAAATGEALQQTPRLRDWMNDPRNAHVARDDVENLSVFERLSRQISDASGRALYNVTRLAQGGGRSGEEQGNADNMAVLALNPLTSPFALPYVTARMVSGDWSRQIGEQFRQGQLDTEYGRLAFRSHQAQIGRGEALTPEEQARLDELAGREGQEDLGPLVLGPTARLAPQMLGSLERAARQTLARVEENAATVGNPWELPEGERWTARRVLADGPIGTGILAATTPIAAFGGFAGGYFGYGNEMETGLAYDQMIRAGVDATIAADRATQYGAWATALEFAGDALGLRFSGLLRIGARAVLGDMALDAGTSAASRLTQSLISTSLDQGAEEASQELAQIIHQDLAQTETRRGTRTPGLTDDPAGYAQDVLSGWRAALTPESIQQILWAGYVGAQGGLGMGAVPASTNFALDMRANAVAERNARVFEEMTRAAQSSRLNERGLTDTLQSAVGAATDQSNVYVDADRFVEHFQSAGVNPYVVADELGLGGESLSQALAAHGQLEIPTSTFAARVLRVPEHAGLAEHARISPTDATPAEVKVATEVLRADIERIAQETEIAQSDNEIGAMVEARMRDLFARAETEGGPRAAVANRYARLVAAMPRAVLARARATNPAYADRLEPQLRRLFGERLDVAGPTRDLDAEPGSALNQDSKKRGTEPFNDARLTARQNKIVEMARNGYPPREIADEMEISAANVSVTLDKIKKKFPDITLPQHKRGGMEGRGAATIEQLVALRAKLLASGYGGLRGGAAHGGEGINSIIAQRFGMEPGNVAKRLSTWDKQQREAAAAGAVSEAASEPAPTKRRSDIYDLPTTEAREEWFKEPGNVISEAIPGEALDSRSYGFALDNGIIVTVEIAPEPTGAATISWTFLHRTLSGAEPFADGEEHLTIRGKGQLLSRIQAVIEADMAEFGRDAYVWTPESDGRMRANRAMIARADGTWPYRLVRAGSDDYLVRDGASVSLMGEVRPSPENAGKEGKWDEDQDQQSIEARKEAFNERLQSELGQAETDQRDGGRSDDLGRGGLEPAGRSPGDRGSGSLKQDDVTTSAAFQRWFGNSKVVDESGAPRVVYHGTTANVEAFDTTSERPAGQARKNDLSYLGSWFSTSTDVANKFAVKVDAWGDVTSEEGANVLPVYLSLQNPRVFETRPPDQAKLQGIRDQLEALRKEGAQKYGSITFRAPRSMEEVADQARLRAEREALYDQLSIESSQDALEQLMDESDQFAEYISGAKGKTGHWRKRYIKNNYRETMEKMRALLIEQGHDGVILRNTAYDADGGIDTQYVAFFPEQIKSAIGNSGAFDPNNPNIAMQSDARGSIRYDSFKAGELGSAVIRLGQSSDLSTFLHEFGHLGHLVLESMATDAEAPAEFKAMWENTLSWWGVDQATWDALSPEQRVPYFEQWARSFEAYLMEGQAPSLGLKEAFAAFREWLLQVYRSILRIDHNLNPQIRDVFDRLLATDGEIAEARAAMGADFQLSREAFGSEAEFQAYVTAIAAARDAQDAELRARIMDSYARKSKRWWRGERERVRDAATRAVDSDKARRAHDWLGFEEWKTLPSTATSDEGELGYVASPNAMEDLPEDLPAMALDPVAIQAEWPDVQLPIAINPRVDPDVVLAEAMRLKGVAKGRGGARAQRLATAVRSWGGVIDGDGRIRAAIGSGRKRPGLVNANGKTAEQLTARAAAEGYFGSGAAKLFLNEQQAEQIADEIRVARSVKPPKTLSAWVREQGGIADDRGDVAGGANDGKRGFARLIRENGRSIDDLALAAWEAGFFPDANERPGVAEFIDALDAEARGARLASDVDAEANYASAQRLLSFWQSVGIETTLSREALKDALWGASDPNAEQSLARELNQAKAPDAGAGSVEQRPRSAAEHARMMADAQRRLDALAQGIEKLGTDQAEFTRSVDAMRQDARAGAEARAARFAEAERILREAGALPDVPDGGARGGEQFDTSRVVYRGLGRQYDPANGGYYQSFTSSLDDAREYGSNVVAAHIRPGRNLAVDGGGRNFNVLGVEQLPADVRARLHPSVGDTATTDQIAHAAREAGYDSVTVRNVHDNRWGERPIAGAEPRTIDFVFNTENIRPLDSVPPQATGPAGGEKVRLSAADRALLDDLLGPDAPTAGPRRLGQDPESAAGELPTRGSDGGELFQSAPIFASAVERVVSESKTARAPGGQWWATISRAPGVKKEELQWIGLEDFLKAQEGQISREDVLAFVRANGVRVEETVLGGDESVSPEVQRELLPLIEERDRVQAALFNGDLKGTIAAATQDARVQAAYRAYQEAEGAATDAQARELDAADPRVVSEDQWAWVIESSWGQRRVSKADYERRGVEGALDDVAQTDRNRYDDLHRLEEQRRLELRREASDLRSRLSERISELEGERRKGAARWSQYQLPGGNNYKELILSVPGIAPFEPTDTVHFGNVSGGRVIAWTRYNERTDVNGLRTLHVEEFQSRRHQFGREHGYKGGAEFQRIQQKLLDAGIEQMTIDALLEQGRGVTEQAYDRVRAALTATELAELRAETGAQRVPDAPFKDNAWAKLALKRMIRWAAENGFEQITWTRGQHQIDRYNLSEAVGEIRAYTDNDGSSFTVVLGNNDASRVLVENGLASESSRGSGLSGNDFLTMTPDQLREAFGNDIAKQIIDRGAPTSRAGGDEVVLSGDDLRVGGEGMLVFYDRIMVNIANDLGKKFGARVGETAIPLPSNTSAISAFKPSDYKIEERDGGFAITRDRSRIPGHPIYATRAEADAARAKIVAAYDPVPDPVHSLPITEEMRKAVTTRPQELFQDPKAPTVEEFLTALIDDLTNARQVYSAKDAGALASAQDLADAQAWFEANDIDLTKDKEAIRAEIVAALEKASERENLYHPDDIAGWFGFSSGDELVQALAALKPRSVAIEEKIDQMLEEEHGDLNSPDKVNAAARLAAHAEAQANRIELELSALEKATKGRTRPVGKAARAYAERQIQRMTIKQVRNFDQYLSGERRAARNAMEATRKGDMAQASMWKQRQLISFWLYRFARDAAEEMDKAQSYFRKFDRDTVRAKIHAPLLDQIDQALESIDLRATPRVSNRRRQSFLAWYDEMKAEGLEHMVAVDPDFLDQVRQRPFNTLTLEEARGLRDAVKNFEHIGRRWREVLAARDNRLLDEAVAEMSASMAKVKPFEATNPADHSPGVVERLDTGRQKLHAQLSRVEFVARAMDGMKENGPVWNGLFRPLTEARDREETRQQQAQRDIEALFSVYDAKERADMWVKRKFYAQVPNRDGSRMGRNFTKQEILAIALNTGNEYNFNALLGGDNWTEQQVRALLDAAMDDRDWRFVQSLWDYVETFWPEIDALQRKATGVSLPKVEATPFQNRYGEWRGGYWHLEYDYGRDQRVREEAEHGKVQEAFGGFRMRTMTPHGFAKARQGSGGRPVRLDLAVLTEHVNEVIHDLEFRLPVLNTWRLIKHSEFRSAFVRAAGQEMYETLKPWLQYVATEQMPPERGFADILRLLRRNTPIALMGFALSTVAQQPAGLMGAFHRVGTGRVMGKVLELASQPWTWMEHARFINTRSTLMRNRSMISQREIREMVQEINSQGHIDAVTLLASGTVRQKMQAMTYLQKMMQRYAMFPLAYLDKWVSSAAWKAAYDRALAGHVEGVDASNEADVISYADHIVRTTFGSGRPEDMSPIMRSSELGKIMTPAFSYFNTQYNQLFNEQTPGMMRGQISPIEFATFITFAMVLQALVSQWLAGRWDPGDDEDEDDRNRRLALEVAMTPTAGIPLIRDITRAALMKASTGRPTFGTSVPAIGAITSTGSGIGGAIHDLSDDGEISRASARDLTMAAGYWFGLPSRQLWTTGSYVSDVATGEEEAPWKSDQPIDSWSEAFLRDTR